MKTTILFCATMFLVSAGAHAADRSVADSLAMSGAAFAAKGDMAKAKDMLYKALANDDACPDAIFELAKIFDKENNTSAASDFYQRASMLMSQENKPATVSKRAEADKRVKALNPFAPRMAAILEDYAQDLDRLVKKIPDSVTQDAAVARVNELKMTSVLTPEKMPKFYATAMADKAATTASNTPKSPSSTPGSKFSSSDHETAAPVNKFTPEIERELKAMGWAKVTGTWVKKSAGVYEVTDGKLEAPKTNGGIDVWVQKGPSNAVKVAVRNDFNSNDTMGFMGDYTGYGIAVKSKEFRVYGPSGMTGFSFNGSRADPSHIKTENFPDANPKNHVLVTVADGVLEFSVNDKKTLRYKDDKLPRGGPFVIEVKGTAIIENPRCAGN